MNAVLGLTHPTTSGILGFLPTTAPNSYSNPTLAVSAPNPRARIMSELNDEDLVDYEEDEALETKGQDEVKKGGTYSGIHASGFRDFLLKPELLRAVVDCGFEHPSEVQHECIPQAILGMDVVCQAKSGMGKTAVPYQSMRSLGLLRRHPGFGAQAHSQERAAAHHRGHARAHPPARPREGAPDEKYQALHPRRMRQDA